MSSTQPGKSVILITVAAGSGSGATGKIYGELRGIYIDAPAAATYDVQILDADGDPVWGRTGLSGDNVIALNNESFIGPATISLSSASSGAYRVVLRRRV